MRNRGHASCGYLVSTVGPRRLPVDQQQIARDGRARMVDVAHYAGLIASCLYPNPVPHAHVATLTTHKTLRGPRFGVILVKRRLERAPDGQGGVPWGAVWPVDARHRRQGSRLRRALQGNFHDSSARVIDNAQALGHVLRDGDLRLVTEGMAEKLTATAGS